MDFLSCLLLVGLCPATPPPDAAEACPFLCRTACQDGCTVRAKEPYVPCAGDLFFGWSGNAAYRAAFRLTRAGPPSHVGMVIRLPDGMPMIFEATTNEPQYGDRPGVFLRPALFRMRTYQGPTWVRKLRRPLTPEQSAGLTDFALRQVGKPFATRRSILVPPMCLPRRGPLGQRLFGLPPLDRDDWFCTEMLITAGMVVGLFDPCVVKPSATDPQDMFSDRILDLSPNWEKPVRLQWETPCPADRP